MKSSNRKYAAWSIGLSLGIGTSTLGAVTEKLASPDNQLEIRFSLDSGQLAYAVANRGKGIVKTSPLSIQFNGRAAAAGLQEFRYQRRSEVRETVNAAHNMRQAEMADHYNALELGLANGVSLEVRAYNDGLAYRWVADLGIEAVVVDQEVLEVRFEKDFLHYAPANKDYRDFISMHEYYYTRKPISACAEQPVTAPLFVELEQGQYLLMTDVNVESYPGLWFQRGASPNSVAAAFPPYPLETEIVQPREHVVGKTADYLARTTGRRCYPWRVFLLSDAIGLAETELLYLLAEPSRIEDVSWIKPGLVVWDWWNDWYLRDVDFEPGCNQATYRYYIDYAAEHGIPYVMMDEGWSQASGTKPEVLDKLLLFQGDINIPALVAHGREKGVGIIIWVSGPTLERHWDTAWPLFKKWGIKGLKIDFTQRDDQKMREFYYRVAQKAAENEMIVDFHGGSKPTGLSRTYPNVLTEEAVKGLEACKWSDRVDPDHNLLIPFIRGVIGPMDYTPGAMINVPKARFKPDYHRPVSLGTHCHQLAMYINFFSPLQMMCDSPSNYQAKPESLRFISTMPTVWDESRALHAEVGAHLVMARRSGEDWYLGAMTNWERRHLSVRLDFLTVGADYAMSCFFDGSEALMSGEDVIRRERLVKAGETIEIGMATGGGFAAHFRKL